MHLWWSRKPLTACRAVIFCLLVDDPGEEGVAAELLERIDALEEPSPLPPDWMRTDIAEQRRRKLFKFIETLVEWDNTTDENVLNTARDLILAATKGTLPSLFDPFCGGGSIPLEAQRLGLEAHGADLNPVAVLITKALIELPPKFAGMPPVNPDARAALGTDAEWKGAAGLAADVRWYGEWMRERAWERIGHLYPQGPNGETVIAWLWARTVACPNPACGAEMPLAHSFWLSKKQGVWTHATVDRDSLRFEVRDGGEPTLAGTVSRQGALCAACRTAVPFTYIRGQGQKVGLGMRLMAVAEQTSSGKSFRSANVDDVQLARTAIPDDAPNVPLPHNPRNFQPPIYGMTNYDDLFTPRQLTALTTFSAIIGAARDLARQHAQEADRSRDADAYAGAVVTYLALAVGKVCERGSTLSTWDDRGGTARTAYVVQGLPMSWNFAETNCFSDVSGSWDAAIKGIESALTQLPGHGFGAVRQYDASSEFGAPEGAVVVTDPPYYRNIVYADISDFFYVWLRRTMADVYPDEFATLLTPKSREIVASPYRFDDDQSEADRYFEQGLFRSFDLIRQQSASDAPMALFYAYKQSETRGDADNVSPKGWETMLSGLIASGFAVTGTWPMRTENPTRTNAQEANALATSVVLVCRSRPADAPVADLQEFNRALALELPVALQRFIGEHIAPVDLPQASIGPGMAVFSRYSAVLAPNGERMSVRRALELINEGVEQFFSEREGSFDTGTQFCLRWFEQFGFEDGAFGDADSIARAKDISVEELSRAGALTAQRGRVRLIPYERYEAGWQGWTPSPERPPTEWQACHYLAAALEHGGIRGQQGGTRGAGGGEHDAGGAARVARDLGGATAARAIELAYRLYAICDAKGWPAEARRYNALADSWQEISAAAHDLRQAEQPRLA